jgi:SAM-dependent methyltransferase
MDDREIVRIYSEKMSSGGPYKVPETDPPMEYLLRFLSPKRDQLILDAGCGDGRYAFALSQHGYTNLVAIDLFETIGANDGFSYRRASVDDTGFSDCSVDFIYCLSVIFYLHDPLCGLREFYRIMKPGAFLVISAHTKYSLFTLDRIIRRSLGKAEHLNGIKFYSAAQYNTMLQDVGFEVVDVDGYGLLYIPPVPPLLRRVRRFITSLRNRQRASSHGVNCRFAVMGRNTGSPKWLKYVRSVFGYHSFITARKPDSPPQPMAQF